MKIVIPDVGQGNCLGIFSNTESLLIDCGGENNKINNFDNFIWKPLQGYQSTKAIITHYHFDHYNFLKNRIPNSFFDKVYLPALPSQNASANAIMEFLALATTLRFKGYPLIPEVDRVAKTIEPLVKDESFEALNKDWEVLWPDYSIIDRIHRKSIEKIREKIREIKEKLSPRAQNEFDYWYECFTKKFSNKESKPCRNEVRFERNQIDPEISQEIENVEKIFKQLTNSASLVVREMNGEFLFPGDISEKVLNRYLTFNDLEYFLVNAPHHGGYYGNALDNVNTEILTVMRRPGYLSKTELFRNVKWKILVDTAKMGNCIVWRNYPMKKHYIRLLVLSNNQLNWIGFINLVK